MGARIFVGFKNFLLKAKRYACSVQKGEGVNVIGNLCK